MAEYVVVGEEELENEAKLAAAKVAFDIGQVVEVLRQRDPEKWVRAVVRSVPNRIGDSVFYNVLLVNSRLETAAVPEQMRECGIGKLEGTFEIVEGCNGLYVYHESGYCVGAGDGSEMTYDDLVDFARSDPAGFAEVYGPW